jgi:hypothetical protein
LLLHLQLDLSFLTILVHSWRNLLDFCLEDVLRSSFLWGRHILLPHCNWHPWTLDSFLGLHSLSNAERKAPSKHRIPQWPSNSVHRPKIPLDGKVFLGGQWSLGDCVRVNWVLSSKSQFCRYSGDYIQLSGQPHGPSWGFILTSLLLSSAICWISSHEGISQKGAKHMG